MSAAAVFRKIIQIYRVLAVRMRNQQGRLLSRLFFVRSSREKLDIVPLFPRDFIGRDEFARRGIHDANTLRRNLRFFLFTLYRQHAAVFHFNDLRALHYVAESLRLRYRRHGERHQQGHD